MVEGLRSSWSRRNASGPTASIPSGASVVAGKSLMLKVTMAWAPPRIAAATTCRSSLAGRGSPASSSSHPVTSASSKVSRMSVKRFCTSMPGWISSIASRASARIRSDHIGRYRRFSAARSRVSASAIGTSAHASSNAAYRGTSGSALTGVALAGFLQGRCVVLGAASVDACLACILGHAVQGRGALLTLPLNVAEQVGEQDPAVPSRLVVGDLSLVKELHERWPADAEEVSGLLSGDPLRPGHDSDHFPLAKSLDDFHQDRVDLFRKRHALAV